MLRNFDAAGGLSPSTIARLKEAWIDEHARWRERDLSAKAVSHRGCRSGIETSGTLEALDSIIVPGTHSRSQATNL